MINSWGVSIWYISHHIAPNLQSVTISVRLVWNSIQMFEGMSLNDLLMKGPDVLNQICAVLLRFISGVYYVWVILKRRTIQFGWRTINSSGEMSH